MNSDNSSTNSGSGTLQSTLPRYNVMVAKCPSRQVLQHLTNRWGVLIMVTLLTDTHRFSQLRKKIEGVSERMLAQSLQLLEQDGMVKRYDYQVIPPHVEYSLTPLGRKIAGKLQELVALIEASENHQAPS